VARIEVVRQGSVVHVHHVGGQPVTLGRAPTNVLAFADARVSSHHAVIALEGDELALTDLRSTNGTTLDGAPVTGRVPLRDGAVVVLGGQVVLHVRATAEPVAHWSPVLIDQSTGLKHRLQADRVHLGSAPDCDVVVDGAPPSLATLLLYLDGPIWIEAGDASFEVRPGEPFELGGRTWLVPTGDHGATRTEELRLSEYPYRLAVSLEGGPGPVARITHLHTGATHVVGSANRAVLLYVLARQLDADRRAGVAPDRAGWCPDGELRSGIWGILQRTMNPNNLQVLIRRVRLELQEDSFDGWCVEKRSGHTRVRVDQVALD
jgi:pSer/pThr/pTyr-binding forkhead associated (FHA) protein